MKSYMHMIKIVTEDFVRQAHKTNVVLIVGGVHRIMFNCHKTNTDKD